MMARKATTTSMTRADLEFMIINEDAEPRPLPYSLLSDITNGFSDDNIIGRGASAAVYKGSIGNRRMVAVKKLLVPYLYEKEFNREVECILKLKHENVVRLLGYCYQTEGRMEKLDQRKHVMAQVEERLLCFEFLPGGDLDTYIKDASRAHEWTQRYQIINGLCQGLHRLHKDRIFHLDLKPQNVLLNEKMVPKIADFGLSRCLEENQSRIYTQNIGGTPGYWAPELFKGGGVTNKCDLYSLGVIIMELLKGPDKCQDYANIDNNKSQRPSIGEQSELIFRVLDSWIKVLEKSGMQLLDQIKVCAQIGIECSDLNPENRPPDTEHIISMLEKVRSAQLDKAAARQS